jgi:hypothetical protein
MHICRGVNLGFGKLYGCMQTLQQVGNQAKLLWILYRMSNLGQAPTVLTLHTYMYHSYIAKSLFLFINTFMHPFRHT